MEGVPTGRFAIVHVATPPVSGCEAQLEMTSVPMRKSTAPDGVAVAGATGLMVAVKVTGSPELVAASLDVTTVVDAALSTLWVMPGAVLVR